MIFASKKKDMRFTKKILGCYYQINLFPFKNRIPVYNPRMVFAFMVYRLTYGRKWFTVEWVLWLQLDNE
jgi:hypothetical protein